MMNRPEGPTLIRTYGQRKEHELWQDAVIEKGEIGYKID